MKQDMRNTHDNPFDEDWRRFIGRSLAAYSINPAPEQLEKFSVHARELAKWNRNMNLTAISDARDVAVKHFVDSAIATLHAPGDARILDMGSGAGFPGVVVKVLCPESTVTLLDSSRKKTSFLKHVLRTLKLEDIEAVQARAEECADREDFQNSFDAIVCRAFSGVEKFVRLATPLLSEGGVLVALKGINFEEKERATLFLKENRINFDVRTYELPFNYGRAVITIYP